MGAIGGLLGVNGGAGGTGFGGPSTNPGDPTGNANLQNSYQQLQSVAAGNGPNPAMAQYNQNIQSLAKQQAGAISSVQGISPALATRLISQQGSGAMQNAAAAGATAESQQQLGAIEGAAGVAGNQAGIASGLQQNVNTTNAGLAGTTMGGTYKTIGGIMNAAGPGAAAAAKGGAVSSLPPLPAGPQSRIGQALATPRMASGGAVPALVSPGEQYLPPAAVTQVARGVNPMQVGERIPGKPKVKGNSYANDVVPKTLEAGGIVIPNSIMQSKNPAKGARDMVAEIISKRKGRK